MSADQRIVIIGGGIWGFSTAFHLAKQCATNVCVLEQNAEAALETTPRAAGLVGQIRSSKIMCDAIGYALDLLSNFKSETGHDPGLHRTGSLLVAMTPERMEAFQGQVARAKENGVDADFVSHDEMKRLAPAIDVSQLEGGYFVSGDGYLDPRQCALAYAAAATDLGVEVRYSTRVTGLNIENERVAGVQTDDGSIAVDQVVITAGPWTGLLSRHANYELPMQTIRHQRARTVPADGIPDHHPVVRVNDVSCYVRPEQGGYLYGFFEPDPTLINLNEQPAEFRTDDLVPPVETMMEAQRRLTPIFPPLAELEIAERTQGITSFAPDGQYLIGPVPDVGGLFVASGCAALGIAGSAAVGQWLAESVMTGQPHDALSYFSHQRFGDQANDRDWDRDTSVRFYGNYYALTPGQSDE